jgi:UDP-N-acetylmuramate--alanine ligase
MKHAISHVHFVGVGGAGMSGIAEILHNLGYKVSGSDLSDGPVLQRLSALGIQTKVGHDASNIAGADAVVTSTAVQSDNPEVIAAHQKLIPVVPRAVMLAELMRLKQGIAIAGTHGKTTTTSLVASVLAQAGLDPTFVIGGRLISAGANAKLGAGDYSVVEADEYDRSFLTLHPQAAVVTSTDADHLDIYGDGDSVLESFQLFVNQIKSDGFFIQKKGLTLSSKLGESTFGIDTGDFKAHNIRIEDHRMIFDMSYPGGEVLNIPMRIPGFHNIENALAAAALAMQVGVTGEEIKDGIASFMGVKRRFEYHVESNDHVMIDDYAHHPTEIAACLNSVKALYPGEKITAVFQPHLFSRTRDFIDDFAKSLAIADEVYLLDIYPARELPMEGVTSDWLLSKMDLKNKQVISKTDLLQVIDAKKPKLLVTMGAGDIDLLLNDLKLSLS